MKTRLWPCRLSLAAVACAAACAQGSPVSPDGPPSGEDEGGEASAIRTLETRPDSVVLQPGERQTFTAEGRGADGEDVPVDPTWSATGGTISDDGVFTAGDSAGTFRVTARDTSGVADSSRVRVPEPGGGGGAAECDDPDPAWIWCDDFEQDRTGAYFEYSDADGSFVREAGVGHDGSTGMRARFEKGQVAAGFLHLAFGRTPHPYFDPVDAGTADHRELYWRLWIRNEPAWTGGGGHKLSRATVFHDSDWSQAMIAPVWSGGSERSRDHLVLAPVSGTDEAGNVQTSGYGDAENLRWLGSVRGDTPLFDGRHVGAWHCVEAHVRLNDPGASDGVFEMWVDGSLDARAEGLNWIGSYTDFGLHTVFVENYWNGGSPQTQERYIDRLVVSTERIGC